MMTGKIKILNQIQAPTNSGIAVREPRNILPTGCKRPVSRIARL
jgi:hypothetical protein